MTPTMNHRHSSDSNWWKGRHRAGNAGSHYEASLALTTAVAREHPTWWLLFTLIYA